MNLLLVEDEPKLAEAMRQGLEEEQHAVAVAPNGEEGFYQLCTGRYDLVILDLGLPGRDGLEILESVRRLGIGTRVLIVTARDGLDDRVRGLDLGADDYLVKPFALPELLARVRALSRRGTPARGARLQLGDLELDRFRHRAIRAGRDLELTAREFELLEYLLLHGGGVVSREMLARDVWKETGRHTPLDNVIDVHVARLRRKLDEPFARKLLHTVRGVGFRLEDEAQ